MLLFLRFQLVMISLLGCAFFGMLNVCYVRVFCLYYMLPLSLALPLPFAVAEPLLDTFDTTCDYSSRKFRHFQHLLNACTSYPSFVCMDAVGKSLLFSKKFLFAKVFLFFFFFSLSVLPFAFSILLSFYFPCRVLCMRLEFADGRFFVTAKEKRVYD